jgi:ubiquinone/menaquinone biosynthesis C-methylase UbiE
MTLSLYGWRLGWDLLLHGRLRHAAPMLIRPVNYWRTLEYKAVLAAGRFSHEDRILDIGSPKLLAFWLADRVGAHVHAVDIHPAVFGRIGAMRKLRNVNGSLRLEVADGRALAFADRAFTKVYSISVLEHIPGDGDSACAREIGRVLDAGGRAMLTLPFARESRDEYTHRRFYWAAASENGTPAGTFYQRRYSEQDIIERIVRPSGLDLVSLRYVGERVPLPSRRELNDLLPAVSGPVQPLLSALLHTPPSDDWRALRKPLCAIVTLARPRA